MIANRCMSNVLWEHRGECQGRYIKKIVTEENWAGETRVPPAPQEKKGLNTSWSEAGAPGEKTQGSREEFGPGGERHVTCPRVHESCMAVSRVR